MAMIDRDAPLRFLHKAFQPDDWIAVLLKSHETGGSAQRVGPCSLVAQPRFQAWLRAQSVRRFSIFISVNAIRPQRKTRTRDAIGAIRHIFLDIDRDGPRVLTDLAARRDLPPPSYLLHSSPNRFHVFWRVTGFSREEAERLQKQLAGELHTDRVATSCAQMTRLVGFPNHKYRPAALVEVKYGASDRVFTPAECPTAQRARPHAPASTEVSRPPTAGAFERARGYLAKIPPAVMGQHGDAHTFRVCCRLARGFALEDGEALALLAEWNARCVPPWTEPELREKLQGARRYGREPIGGLLTARP